MWLARRSLESLGEQYGTSPPRKLVHSEFTIRTGIIENLSAVSSSLNLKGEIRDILV